jgi:hypothetical protein
VLKDETGCKRKPVFDTLAAMQRLQWATDTFGPARRDREAVKKPHGSMAKATYSASAQALPHRMSRLFTEIRWILQVALGVFLLMALVSYTRRDPSWTHAAHRRSHRQLGGPRRRVDVRHPAAALRASSAYWLDRAARPAHRPRTTSAFTQNRDARRDSERT